ncbi:GAF domain-containing protein [Marivirga sericea]|uniref:GAF domain-containing protein n=1 Tax=Marivirga sericea TaxID=1028 RepID=A0A1X7JKC2_9BACT|nr:GAF domain-containing protein [Marivirga sericea]SMG27784.1 GAF domain-containing protein [Marivirga sericea]
MSESLLIDVNATKEEKYKALLPQIKALVHGEEDVVANLSNITAALKEAFGYFWIGFYIAKNGELVLGPFQGPIACTRIQKGKGVCGSVWAEGKTIIVPDVEAFPGHIACSSASKSEIVVPGFKNNEVAMVLDIDSDELNTFDEIDQKYLEDLMKTVSEFL